MNFIEKDNTYYKYYDEFVVLPETDMRVSEFSGLTRKELPLNHMAESVFMHFQES